LKRGQYFFEKYRISPVLLILLVIQRIILPGAGSVIPARKAMLSHH